MTEQENELLEMYIRYIKKRNLIIFIIVFIVVVFCIFGFYKIKSISNNVEESNLIEEVVNEENIIKEEVKVENNIEINKQKFEEKTQTENIENTTISNEKIEIEKKEEDKKEKTEKVENNKQESSPAVSKKYENKDFLFKDGYTMENVTQAAQEYLKQSGQAGQCIPIKDNEGIYIGMRVIFN